MAGETTQTYATKELELFKEEKKSAIEQFNKKALKGSPEHFENGIVESKTVNNSAKFVEKEKDNVQQREAVIRPQQAGKIDFKSLQNRSKFSSDGTWLSGKSSPQSPSGRNRNRDKGKKSGKTERGNPQQLYRLSITNPRSNPTIGIAYPQQKLLPPKKLEASQGPVSGSYRFHVPSIAEREVDLQQEEFNLNLCYQEGSSNLTPPSYTSQPVGSAAGGPAQQHPPPSAPQQQPNTLETSNTSVNQMLFPDFQLSRAEMWQSPDRTFSNASFVVPSQKSNNVADVNKANGFIQLPFQYGYPMLEDTVSDSFCDPNPQPQDLIDAPLGPNQVAQNTFSFPSSGEEHDVVQNNIQFSYEQSEDRTSYPVHSKPPQYVQTSHGTPPSMHCTKSIGEGGITSENSESTNHQSENKTSSLSDKSDSFCPADTRDAGIAIGGKRGFHAKNGTSCQRNPTQSSVQHIRNIAQAQSPQLHFSKKAYNCPSNNIIPMGSVPHDKNHSRVAQPWEGPNKAFTSVIDQNSTSYPFQCQPPLEQRQNTGINNSLAWQQIHLTSAMTSQNRIELSRQLSNQQMGFLISPADWKEDIKSPKNTIQKSSSNFSTNSRTSEVFSKLRQDNTKKGCTMVLPSQFSNKVESNASDDKNKSLYFSINHAVDGSTPKAQNYPSMHVPAMEVMMVSLYDSPSHSPIQNQISGSTCSSLSPDTTSPASSISDDSQNTKVSPPPFYTQHQGKVSLDSLSSNQHHYHSEVSRNVHYNQEKAKDNIVSFPPNIRHLKPNMESGKGSTDNYVTELHPPPPYSAHPLLASSLATANLDQLDVLLTCKQCERNFSNLPSFLEHKHYCGQHTFAQNDFKDFRKGDNSRKVRAQHTKAISSGTSFCMSKSSSDLHLSLLGLNKNGEIMPESENKADAKDDPMKLMLPSAPLPDLEMEDAKLDSLITEALNGYQSDNAEIDSSFIDAFVDDEITTTKCSSNKQTLKTKDSVLFENRSRHEFTSSEKSLKQEKYSIDSDLDCLSAESNHQVKENHQNVESHKQSTKEEMSLVKRESSSEQSSTRIEWVKERRKSDKTVEESEHGSRLLISRKFSERGEIKTLQGSTPLVKTSIPQPTSPTKSPTSQRPVVREGKRKRISGGSWSKELIHKIVQQKNKLHNLHVKGTKNMQFSVVMERVTPTIQNPTFREYDYISDSDEDCGPVKIASQGRLSQSIRCKYTYTKECKGRIKANKNRESPWNQDKIECFESKKAEALSPPLIKEISGHPRMRRRSSRSSTSSELSTSVSISSESISSPKSTDRTDSDCEKREKIRKKDQDSFEQKTSPQRILKESSTSLALTFTKNTKHYSTDKILVSELKDCYTTSTCSSNVISTTEETAEHTLTKSTVSLARFKTTRVEVEEKLDHYGCEIGILASTEEPAPLNKDNSNHIQASMHLRKPAVTLKKSDKETSDLKIKTNNASVKEKPSHKMRKSQNSNQDPESSPPALENFSDDIALIKERKPDPSDLLSDSQSLCSSLMDEMCLSPVKLHDEALQKDRNSLMPYTLENDQSLIKSPLSFDTSSMFSDLTVGGFDNNLYPDIQLTKDSFGTIESVTDKKELFESSFSPLLEQRDWSMIVDVTPELPDEISQYKEDSDPASDKHISFNNVPFTLTEKIMDYPPNLISCASEDELEIKRIVTELESQLQSAKLRSPSPLDSEPPQHLTMSKFSPLRLDHESEVDQSSLVCPSESLALAAPTDSNSELFSEPDLPWTSPVQFELMGGQQCLHTPTHPTVTDPPSHLSQDLKNSIDLSTEKKAELNINEKSESCESLYSATDKSEEMIEHEIYTENLMKSLEVMSDSLSSGLESPQPHQQQTYSGAEDQEKQNNQKTLKNQDNKADTTDSVLEHIEFPSDFNKTFQENRSKFLTQDICESKLDSTQESTSVAKGSDVTLHYKDTLVNKLQPCKLVFIDDREVSLNKIHLSELPLDIFEHKTCESPETVETGKTDLKPQTLEYLNSKSLASNSNVPTAFPDEMKGQSMMGLKQEISQVENLLRETNTIEDYKGILNSVSPKHSNQNNETETDTMAKANYNLDQKTDPSSTELSFHEGAESHEILKNDNVITKDLSEIDSGDQHSQATAEKASSHTTANASENSELQSVSPVCPSPLIQPYIPSTKTTVQAEKSSIMSCWQGINKMTPALTEEQSTFKSSEELRSLQDFSSHLEFSEPMDNTIPSSGTILAVHTISRQSYCEANEESKPQNVTQNRDTLYEFKLSPMSCSETNFKNCIITSETFNQDMGNQLNLKASPKDSLDISVCAMTLNTETSNCRLSPIHVQNELELTNYDHFDKLGIPQFHNTISQNDVKYPSIPPPCYVKSGASNVEQLSTVHQDDMNTCHVSLDSIDYMDLHINLLKKTDAENVDTQITSGQLSALSQKPSLSNSQKTQMSKEHLPAGITSVPTTTLGQTIKQTEVKSSPKKGCAQNAVQGDFQCEICLLYFRTLPGLKRHKAMKHTVKSEGHTTQTPSGQGLVKDSIRLSDPDLPEKDGILEGTSKETKKNDQKDMHLITEKARENNVKRSKSVDANNDRFNPKMIKQDPFPDELLTILKTDILQAISPDFPLMAQTGCPKPPQKEGPTNSTTCLEKVTEEHQNIENAKAEVTAFTKSPELYNHVADEENAASKPHSATVNSSEDNGHENAISDEYAGSEDYTAMNEISDSHEDTTLAIKYENDCPTDTNATHSEGYKDQPLSPSGLGPDPQALFDDENTFSQLFPRNNEMKRKRCARVYGKSNKKQRQMASLISDYPGPEMFLDKNEERKEKTDHLFVSGLNDNCEYKTVSLDDAKMFEMCHKNALNNSPPTIFPKDASTDHLAEHNDATEAKALGYLCQSESDISEPLVNLNVSKDTIIDTLCPSDAPQSYKSEEPCPLQMVCVEDNVSCYPSVDIPNIKTTYELPEIQFFEPGTDLSLVETTPPKKSPKKLTVRRGKKHSETGLKPKDKQYKCKVCFTWFLTLGELDFHKLSHNPSPPPTCYMCVQRKFSSREQLRDHLKEKHVKNKAGVWTCGMCLKEISDVWMYNEHLREHATQFARKGQSQGSLLDMPGCFMQENAVKNFISSIMQHQSKKAIKDETLKSSKEERKAFIDAPGLEQKSSDTAEPETAKPKGISAEEGSKHASFTPTKVLSKTETTPKNIEMHPNCKDPSRDCHHCGKQFPKPFKLQRHLVVHNLQKIFMCHKCPVSYQQVNELKDHLKNEHEEVDELDSKHTTLYTCELCADVMHVIKKSFICSTCNYTFSKKEQFDRHMEKHLAGANKIFKFRGVVRPCKPYTTKDNKCDKPPNKRRKVLSQSDQENCLDSGIASIASTYMDQNTDVQSLKSVTNDLTSNDIDQQLNETANTNVKIEDMAEDLFGALEELGKCQSELDSADHTLSTQTMPKEEDKESSHAHEYRDTKEVGTDNKGPLAEICDVKVENDCAAAQTTSPVLILNESPKNRTKDATKVIGTEDLDQSNSQNPSQINSEDQKNVDSSLKKNNQHSLFSKINQLSHDQMNKCSSSDKNENEQIINQTEPPTCILVKDRRSHKPEENIKQCNDNNPKSGSLQATDIASVNLVKIHYCSDIKVSARPKKRKAPKLTPNSPKTLSPVARENLGIDSKLKKKFQSNKCERSTGQRKADVHGDYPVLTSVKEDIASNKIVSKQKIRMFDLQPKRDSTDNFSPKKGEIVHHFNLDCRKKSVSQRLIHSPSSKGPVGSLNNSFNKSRPKPGAKSVESQNLLNELFGQRLTGFKIPLRKDAS
ncbi:uncharacterized protein LOC134317079 [Trichomycterus rosablanca]|uniref:uncharacterized protein LOC134317079 n=1 Tax=Trichomycterus rosablanca TaxID=2290929 RepID=UPI002F35069A